MRRPWRRRRRCTSPIRRGGDAPAALITRHPAAGVPPVRPGSSWSFYRHHQFLSLDIVLRCVVEMRIARPTWATWPGPWPACRSRRRVARAATRRAVDAARKPPPEHPVDRSRTRQEPRRRRTARRGSHKPARGRPTHEYDGSACGLLQSLLLQTIVARLAGGGQRGSAGWGNDDADRGRAPPGRGCRRRPGWSCG